MLPLLCSSTDPHNPLKCIGKCQATLSPGSSTPRSAYVYLKHGPLGTDIVNNGNQTDYKDLLMKHSIDDN